MYAIREGEGFIVITGRPGTGKTTLIESFLKELKPTKMVATRIATTNIEPVDPLRSVAYAYGIDAEGSDKVTLLRHIEKFLIQQKKYGKKVLLFIDEAQGLTHAALEELRLLADLQSGSNPLLQIFLVGQESLKDLMHAPDMEQLQQRVIVTCHLEPLNLPETRAYLEHRLRRVNWKGDPELTGTALLCIYQYSKGVPRHINKMMSRLLLYGVMEEKHTLDKDDVLTVATELREKQLSPLESKQAELQGRSTRLAVPELEDGSVTMAELALRAESEEEVERVAAAAREAPGVERQPPAHQAASRPVVRHIQPVTQPQPVEAPMKEHAAWWQDIFVLGRALRRYIIETAQHLNDRLPWPGGLAVKLAALVVISLSIAGLITHSEDEVSDLNTALAVHSETTEPLVAVEKIAAVKLESKQPQPAAQNIVSSSPVAAERQASETPLAAQATAIAAGNITQQQTVAPQTPIADAAMPDPLPPEPEDRQASLAAVTAMPAGSADATQRAPVDTAPPGEDAAMNDNAAMGAGADAVPQSVELAPPMPVEPEPLVEHTSTPPASISDDISLASISLAQKIDELLSLGRQALNEDRLSIPRENNAYHYYRQVLILDPNNAEASDGIDHIVKRYILFAERALDREDDLKSGQFIERGLRIQPGDSQLLALQERRNNWLARLELEAIKMQAPPPAQVAEPPPPPPPPEPQDFMSRLKAFFSKGQSGDQGKGLLEE
jgi:type II secretory pathway predicted ATPase ExeA